MVIDTAREPDKSFLKNTAVKRETNCSTFCDALLICFAKPAAETQNRDYFQSFKKII
jgi:hypothetical protein